MASGLEKIESQRESAESIKETEGIWVRQAYGLKGSLLRLMTYKSIKQVEARWIGKLQTQQARAAKLSVTLAARAYELERGQYPQKLADLVPEYLKAVPIDPATGQPMNYRP